MVYLIPLYYLDPRYYRGDEQQYVYNPYYYLPRNLNYNHHYV